MYTATTHDLTVRVQPEYLPEQSAPADHHYVWAYTIQVENHGKDAVQLLSRHWKITNALGHVEEVRGPGVVGEQPILQHGEAFRYTSGTHLNTPSGIMSGTYHMIRLSDGSALDIPVPPFSLDSPYDTLRRN